MSAFCTESAKLFKPDPRDRKSTRLNSSHTEIYTLSLHDALPISSMALYGGNRPVGQFSIRAYVCFLYRICQAIQTGSQRSEEHTSELQSHRDLHSFPTRRSSDLQHGLVRWKQASWAILHKGLCLLFVQNLPSYSNRIP